MAFLKRDHADLSSSESDSEETTPKPKISPPKKAKISTTQNKSSMSTHQVKKQNSEPIEMNGARSKLKHVTLSTSASHWSQGLLASMKDASAIVSEDETTVIIRDKYPKAKHHYLVMPKDVSLRSLHVLSYEQHGAIFQRIKSRGLELKEKLIKDAPKLRFRFGFHASPSMTPLHAHLISQDFDSSCLKTKKHWNSFTTQFFRDFEEVEKELKETGSVAKWDSKILEELLKSDLRCHVCRSKFSNMPSLLEHVKSHS